MANTDRLADFAAREAQPPQGRVHLHMFIRRNGIRRVEVADDAGRVIGRTTSFDVEWRVSTKASPVCAVPGRCVMAEVLP